MIEEKDTSRGTQLPQGPECYWVASSESPPQPSFPPSLCPNLSSRGFPHPERAAETSVTYWTEQLTV